VLWGREFLPAMQSITGDVGARHLVGLHADRLVEVEMPEDGVLRDFDTAVLEDGCAAFSPAVHATAIDALRPVCRVASISEIMREIEAA